VQLVADRRWPEALAGELPSIFRGHHEGALGLREHAPQTIPDCSGYISHPPHDRSGMSRTRLERRAAITTVPRVLRAFARWAGGVVADVVRRVHSAARAAMRPTPLFFGLVEDTFRSRQELIAEHALVRQQLIVASRSLARPSFKAHERGLMVLWQVSLAIGRAPSF
jgi:hypothetical protein